MKYTAAVICIVVIAASLIGLLIKALYEKALPARSSIIVAGAAGFLGYHLSALAAEKRVNVIALDNFSNVVYSPSYKLQRAWSLLLKHGVDVIHRDICDDNNLLELLRGESISHVVYFGMGDHVSRGWNVDGNDDNGMDACMEKIFSVSDSFKRESKQKPPLIIYTFPGSYDYSSNSSRHDHEVRIEEVAKMYSSNLGVHSVGVHIPPTIGPWPRMDRPPYVPVFGRMKYSELRFSFVNDVTEAMFRLMRHSSGKFSSFYLYTYP